MSSNKISEMACFKCGNKTLIIDDKKIRCYNVNCLDDSKKQKFIKKANNLMNFGKFKDEKIINVIKNDRAYIDFLIKKNANNTNTSIVNKTKTFQYLIDNFEQYKNLIY